MARCCGNIPILATERDKWNFWGHEDGWFRSLGRWEAKLPGKRSWKEWRARVDGKHVREELEHFREKGEKWVEDGKQKVQEMREKGRTRSKSRSGEKRDNDDEITAAD